MGGVHVGHTFFMIAASTISELASLSGYQSSTCQYANAALCFIAGAYVICVSFLNVSALGERHLFYNFGKLT